jgi:3-hydroxybutyryl-CoA dehydrogenase
MQTVEQTNPQSSADWAGLALVTRGRDEGLPETLRSLEEELGPEMPILCQCVDVTLSEASSWLGHPERMVGFDSLFFPQPIHGENRSDQEPEAVVTLVATARTTQAARAAAERLSAGLGCTPLWIDDAPALVLPRIIACLANEAAFAAGEGVADPETIDLAMRLGMNYPKGPLTWAKEIGYAQICAILAHLQSEYGEDRYRAAPLLRRWARLA